MRQPLEANTRSNFDQILINLNYIIDETDKQCNVYKERAKNSNEDSLLGLKRPDYIIYESESNKPIAIVEAKKIGQNLNSALEQAKEYAEKLSVSLIFATNDTFITGYHLQEDKQLKIDGTELQQFVDEKTLKRFIAEGSELISNPVDNKLTKEMVLKIFKQLNKLLRKEGLRTGEERFSAISDLLFLKLIDEQKDIAEYVGNKQFKIGRKYSWEALKNKSDDEIVDYLNDSIRPRLVNKYGEVFKNQFVINKPGVLIEVIEKLDSLKLATSESDIKGDAFEYFLRNLTNGNKDLGEYYTPRHITKLMVNIVEPKYGEKIYDPFCGTGGFLIEVFKFLCLRVDMSDANVRKQIKQHSIYGREISSTARIAKMNMILFGDGSTNIEKMDSLEKPVKGKYNIAISNIPYSQESEYGDLYKLNTKNADAICVKHMWDSLVDNGKLAVIVPDTFLYEGGAIEDVRRIITNNSKNITVISLPRGVFNPYTPTKTSIIIAEKKNNYKPDWCYFYVIDNDGFELGARRRPISGISDLSKFKIYYENKLSSPPHSVLVQRLNKNYSFLPYNYMEDIPQIAQKNGSYLSGMIKRREVVKLSQILEEENNISDITLLEVSQKGITIADVIDRRDKEEVKKLSKHSVVYEDDIVFNPHRINVGSIGRVYGFGRIMIVSPIYEIFQFCKNIDINYALALLQSKKYKTTINHYAIGGARPIFKIEQLEKIKIPLLSTEKSNLVKKYSYAVDNAIKARNDYQNKIEEIINNL